MWGTEKPNFQDHYSDCYDICLGELREWVVGGHFMAVGDLDLVENHIKRSA